MKICVIAYTFYEIDHRVRRYAESLAEQGHEVDAIVLRGKGQPSKDVLNGVNLYRIQKRTYDEKNLFDYAFRIGTFFLKGTLLLVAKQIRSKYTVLHINNVPDFLVFMGLIPKMFGTKIILDIHDVLPEFYAQKFNRGLDTRLAKILLFLERHSVRFADHTIVANDLWREKIIRRDNIQPEVCTTILNYPNLDFFKPIPFKANREELIIVYPGTISQHHGIDIAIRALALVKKQIKNVQFNIYTRSNNMDYFHSIKQLIAELNLQENVKIYDPVPAEELGKIFSNASMGIVPKRGGIFADEAFSTKIFDFLAVGLPVIVSKTKIDEYYFDDSMMMFFEPENHEDLARCIIELYHNDQKRRSLVEHGNDYIALNSWQVKKGEYIKLVDSVAAGKKDMNSRAVQKPA
jgi:glycosyltransferase involved in cell wall biosynthesis